MRRLSIVLLVLNICVILFTVSGILSLNAAYDPALSQPVVWGIVFSAMIYFVVMYAARPRLGSRIIASTAVVGATLLAFLFVTQFKYGNYEETPAVLRRLGEMTSVLHYLKLGYINANSAATFLEMLLPICVGLAIGTHKLKGLRYLLLVCALLMAYAILLTASRGAWIGLTVSGLGWSIVYLLRRTTRRRAIVYSIVLVVLAAAGVAALVMLVPRVSVLASTVQAFNDRLTLYRNTLYLIGDYFFTGIGPGTTFAMVYSRFSLMIFVPFLSYPSNLLLAVWMGQGVLGMIAFVGMVVLFYVYALRVLLRAKAGAVFYGATVGVTATFIHGLADARQYLESPWVMPALFFGMALALACGARAIWRAQGEFKEAGILPSPRFLRVPAAVTILVAVLAIGFVAVYNKQLQALWQTNQGTLNETRADDFISLHMDEAERNRLEGLAQDSYQKALTIDADLPNANRRLGNLLVSQEKYTDAIPLLEKAAEQETTNPAAIKGLGLAYTWSGRTDDAAKTFLHLQDSDVMSQELITWHQFRTEQGRFLLAAYALETAILMDDFQSQPNFSVWVLIAEDYRKGGNTERARGWYERVLEQDPDNNEARQGLAAISA